MRAPRPPACTLGPGPGRTFLKLRAARYLHRAMYAFCVGAEDATPADAMSPSDPVAPAIQVELVVKDGSEDAPTPTEVVKQDSEDGPPPTEVESEPAGAVASTRASFCSRLAALAEARYASFRAQVRAQHGWRPNNEINKNPRLNRRNRPSLLSIQTQIIFTTRPLAINQQLKNLQRRKVLVVDA